MVIQETNNHPTPETSSPKASSFALTDGFVEIMKTMDPEKLTQKFKQHEENLYKMDDSTEVKPPEKPKEMSRLREPIIEKITKELSKDDALLLEKTLALPLDSISISQIAWVFPIINQGISQSLPTHQAKNQSVLFTSTLSDKKVLDIRIQKVNGKTQITLQSSGPLYTLIAAHMTELKKYLKDKKLDIDEIYIEESE